MTRRTQTEYYALSIGDFVIHYALAFVIVDFFLPNIPFFTHLMFIVALGSVLRAINVICRTCSAYYREHYVDS